jgi:hypothetical protein
MTLGPGETGQLTIELPADVHEAIERGAILSYENGPVIETGPQRYERMVYLLLDGKRVATVVISWDSKPPKEWYRRVWNRLLRRRPGELLMG